MCTVIALIMHSIHGRMRGWARGERRGWTDGLVSSVHGWMVGSRYCFGLGGGVEAGG